MKPATDWTETVPGDETARFEAHAEALRDLQRGIANGGAASRGLHAKGQAGVAAELTVMPDLPEHARIGLFATPTTYPAYVRFSNGSNGRQADKKPDVRGLAIKVVGVPGKKIIPGMEDAQTQDFLLIQSPTTPFKDADEFVAFVRAAGSPASLLPKMIGQFGLVRAFKMIRRMVKGVSAPVISRATIRYFSALPIKYGPYAVHYALQPHASPEPNAKRGSSPDYLEEELATRLKQGPVVFDFRVQFYGDKLATPIEDASVEWKEADAPFITVARLTLPEQDIRSPRGARVSKWVEELSFDPWHALEEHRPLGNMMRARNAAYRLSTKERGAAGEPDGTEKFD